MRAGSPKSSTENAKGEEASNHNHEEKRLGRRTRGGSPSQMIDARIRELGDWRGEVLGRVRGLIREADPDVVEEMKWRKPSNPGGVPVWSHEGMICTGETYKDKVKF